MGGASSYLAILAICGFLSAAWMATKLSKMAGVSSIVLEIATGVILGPSVLGLISGEYATCEHKRWTTCDLPSEFEARVKEGLPFGADLDRIAGMDYCTYWQHDAVGHGDGGHGDADDHSGADMGHGDGDEDHGSSGGNSTASTGTKTASTTTEVASRTTEATAGTTKAVPATTTVAPATVAPETTKAGPATTMALGAPTTTRGAAWEDEGDTVHPRGGNDDPDDGSRGAGRRLSGGGGGKEYSSYGMCLEKSCLVDISHECGLTPDVFTLVGHAGVALMIFESGMHFDFEKAMVVGPKACAVAVLGTILPLLSGTILMMIYGYPVLAAIAVGTALAPTSVGIALRLLGEAGVLQTDFGQAIITAAFVDDILSLVLFNVLFSLKGDFNVFSTVVSPIIGIIFMGIAMVLAVKFWPKAINEWILPRLPKRSGESKVSIEDEALFLIMMLLLVAYSTITHFLGTHLWGCFIAGMSFACIDKEGHKGHTHHVWVRQTKRITSWMIRIFFACTVAFSIPIGKLLSIDAFLKGSLMGIGPCILSKVCCAPFMGNARWVIGWAMVGRAEFAYLIAQMAAAANMIDEATFSISIWALLYATVFAPFVFRTVLNRYIAREGLEVGPSVDIDAADSEGEEEIEGKVFGEVRHDHRQAREIDSMRKVGSNSGSGAIENAKFGKPEELQSIILDIGTAKGSESDDFRTGIKKQAANNAAASSTSGAEGNSWFGSRPAKSATNTPNGFLCCLFFKKVAL